MCYTYDSLSRVTARTVKKLSDDSVISTETFTYDAAGNVTDAPDSCFSYDTNNRLLVFKGNAVSYDPDGNMLSNSMQSFTYDSANRLLSADGHTYTYNAENVRIRNLCESEDTTYTYDTNTKLSKLLCKTTNGVTTKYVYGRGLIGEESNNTFKTYHFDCRGSTIAITFAKYYKEYLNLDAQLETLRLHTPVNYLRKDGVIKGFNADGNLVVIFDSYGNYYALSYDKRTVDGREYTYITGIIDQDERQVIFNYDANFLLTSVVTPNGERTEYTYESDVPVTITYHNGKTITIDYSGTNITKVTSDDLLYSAISYSAGSVSTVKTHSEASSISGPAFVGGNVVVSQVSLSYKDDETTITDEYGNQEIYVFTPEQDRLKMKLTVTDGKVSSAEKYVYSQNEYEIVEYAKETILNLEPYESFVFERDKYTCVDYDKYRRAIREETTWKHSVISAAKPCVITHHTYEYSYKQTADKALDSIGVNGNTVRPNTDVLGRNIGKSIAIGENKVAEEKISYVKFGDHATNMPSTVRFASNGVFNESMQYRYDAMGNIIEVLENGRSAYRYEYDTLGRLTREDNKAFAKTTTWAYDNNGNIIARYEYAITAKPTSELHLLNGTCKLYTDADNSDQLMSYNGEAFEYDVIGNPTTYRGKSATWAYGRQLATYDGNTFAYDARGRRTAKNGITFTYDSNGNLIKQSNGLEFFYDHTGVFAVKYNGSTYFYRKNAQNDIISLLDNNGSVLVKYKYDAWGKCIIDASTTNTELANLNPFRYRSYYYDVETSLYFLKTRYYDPETGRFITIDDILYLDPESINGLNLYAYCGNNPIMYYDPTGHLAFFIITAIIGAVIGLGLTAYSDYADDGKIFNGSISLWSYLGNTLVCGAIGAFAGAFVSAATTANIFSTATSVLRGAQTLYSFYKTVGATGAVYMMLDNLQNAVHYIPHVFWSGGDVAKNTAAEFAKINGYTTLEMTRVGQYLEGMAYNPKAWELASYNFAHQVPNFSTVHAILYYPQMRENAIWYTQEIIELSKRMINIIFGR